MTASDYALAALIAFGIFAVMLIPVYAWALLCPEYRRARRRAPLYRSPGIESVDALIRDVQEKGETR